uniref:RING-type domain-containing protein n=1 Tax=Scophthalmus maximus TaxID=52904 RepID=A0A8D3BHB0_SCOMX
AVQSVTSVGPPGPRESEDDFLCAICLDVFTDPVSTPCGHNFCKHCITTHWDMTVPSQCPMCKVVFDTRPELRVNTPASACSVLLKERRQSCRRQTLKFSR